ncbi:hypothetical protein U6G28_09015 [Actinomycetaceae bacterium MB13-C1-2]|nr:hypothetical protein U6G28_09015 [Actinomycetaceae bacterium MB13-C1-2]
MDWIGQNALPLAAIVVSVVTAVYASHTRRQVALYKGPELVLETFWGEEDKRTYFYVRNVGESPARHIRARIQHPLWPLFGRGESVPLASVPPETPKSKSLGKGQLVTFCTDFDFFKEKGPQGISLLRLEFRDKAGRKYRQRFIPSVRMERLDEGAHYYD